MIAALAKCHVDLNQSCQGATLAFIAAQNGHVCVIEELTKHLDVALLLNQPYIASKEQLLDFATGYEETVIKKMNQLINYRIQANPHEKNIAVFPDEIAYIMGHNKMVEIFSNISLDNRFYQITEPRLIIFSNEIQPKPEKQKPVVKKPTPTGKPEVKKPTTGRKPKPRVKNVVEELTVMFLSYVGFCSK